MKPTAASTLALVSGLGLALGFFLAVTGRHGNLTELPVGIPVTLGIVALAEWFTSRSVRDRLSGKEGARSMDPTAIPTLAALARASSLTGALAAGAWLVLLVDRLDLADTVDAAQRDAVVAGAGLITALLLVLAALRLESVCRAR